MPSAFSLVPFVVLCCAILLCPPLGDGATPPRVGFGYKLISVEEIVDGGLVGHLQVRRNTTRYGPDIPHLRLFVK